LRWSIFNGPPRQLERFFAPFTRYLSGRFVFGDFKGLMGTLLRYPYEVRDEKEYFDEIEDVKVTKDMLDLAKHINAKRNGQTISAKPRPKADNVVNLMLKKSIASEAPKGNKPRKAVAGQKEMLLPIEARSPRRKKP
jgi:DNA end-binding protein Ku